MSAQGLIIDNSYVLHEELGHGGMGTVFSATQRLNGQVVALKLLRIENALEQDESEAKYDFRMALAREFQTLASLHHPHVIQVLSYGFDRERGPYFTMELLNHPQTLLDATQHFPLQDKIYRLAELLRGLEYIHRRGILHRDLKPGNVLCVDNQVKIVDFGIAVEIAQVADLAGTVEYMAPELLLGRPASVASDLYAVGVILYQILTGGFPYSRDSMSRMVASILGTRSDVTLPEHVGRLLGAYSSGSYVVERTQTNLEIDEDSIDEGSNASCLPEVLAADFEGPLGDVLRRLLARNPGDRYPNAPAVLEALSRAIGESLPIETAATRESFLQAAELIGRESELAALSAALQEAVERRGSGWLLGGESGVGKSRLVNEVRTHALVRGAWVAQGQAVSEGGSHFQVWLPVLRMLCLKTEVSASEAAILKDLLSDIEALLGYPVGDAPEVAPAIAQERLFHTIVEMFRRLKQSAVVLLEDLQWAGAESIALAHHLSMEMPGLPALLIGNFRREEAPKLPEQLPRMKAMYLDRLNRAHIARLSASMLGESGEDTRLVNYLHRETEGNVFFLIEIVRVLAEQAGRLSEIWQSVLPEQLFTGGIERIVERRVDRVPIDDRPLLELAAVQGQQLDAAILHRLAPHSSMRQWLMTCAHAGVLESREGAWSFSYEKLRETIIRRIPAERRRHLHLRVAMALEDMYAGPALEGKAAALAFHFQQAGVPAKACHYFLKAGDAANRLCAYSEARGHYANALDALQQLPVTPEHQRQQIDTLIKQVQTTVLADSPDQNLERINRAKATLEGLPPDMQYAREDRLRRARVFYWMGRLCYVRNQLREAVGFYQQVLPVAQEYNTPELLAQPSLMIGIVLHSQGKMGQALPLLAQAIAPLKARGEAFDEMRARVWHGVTLVSVGRIRAGMAAMERALQEASEQKQPTLLSLVHILRCQAYFVVEDWNLLCDAAHAVLALTEQTGDNAYRSVAWSWLAWAESYRGNIQDAFAARAKARKIAEGLGGRLMGNDWFAAADAEIALNAGQLTEAIQLASTFAATARAAGLVRPLGVAERAWGFALWQLQPDAVEEAQQHLAESIQILSSGDENPLVAHTHQRWAALCRQRGDEGGAHLHEQLAAQLLVDPD